VSVERDVLERLAALELPHYVTGSWALAVYAEPRMTRDIDVVVDMTTSDYAARVRRAFERDFVAMFRSGGLCRRPACRTTPLNRARRPRTAPNDPVVA